MAQDFFQVAISIQVNRVMPVETPQGPGLKKLGGLAVEAVGEGRTQAEAYKAAEANGAVDSFVDGLKAVEVVTGDFAKQ